MGGEGKGPTRDDPTTTPFPWVPDLNLDDWWSFSDRSVVDSDLNDYTLHEEALKTSDLDDPTNVHDVDLDSTNVDAP